MYLWQLHHGRLLLVIYSVWLGFSKLVDSATETCLSDTISRLTDIELAERCKVYSGDLTIGPMEISSAPRDAATMDLGIIQNVQGHLTIKDINSANVDLEIFAPELEAVGTLSLVNTNLASELVLFLPSLASSGSLKVNDNPQLTSLVMPALHNASNIEIINNAALKNIRMPSLATVSQMHLSGNFTSVSLPQLTSGNVTIRAAKPFSCPEANSSNVTYTCDVVTPSPGTTGAMPQSEQIGVGVGVSVSVSLLLTGLGLFWYRRRNQRASRSTKAEYDDMAELSSPESQHPQQLDGTSRAELHQADIELAAGEQRQEFPSQHGRSELP